MDVVTLTNLFRGTIDPYQRKQAEEQLTQVHSIAGFAPTLLQLVMINDYEMSVRQAGAVYLKNFISQHWEENKGKSKQPVSFSIHEQDKFAIRDSIVDAVVHAPELIKTQLCSCVSHIIKHDFPRNWINIVDKIKGHITSQESNGCYGALLCLHQLVKHFEHKKAEDRSVLHEAMKFFLHHLYKRMIQLQPDSSEQSVLLQKIILKIYSSFTQYTLPLDIVTNEVFTQWMDVCKQIVDRPVPPSTLQVCEDMRRTLPWWKCKKWAMHILFRMFERYGSPENVAKEYNSFAGWFLHKFSGGVIEVLLHQLDMYRNNVWISPRVLQLTLNYLNKSVSHALSWKYLKPHMPAIIQDIIFPTMCYSLEDDELWKTDPPKYIRVKFDVFEDYISPASAARNLLRSSCKKRKHMLQKTMLFLKEVLDNPVIESSRKDGALHMVGSLASVLIKKKAYSGEIDKLITQHVLPEFSSSVGHMRARACWVIHYFSEADFKNSEILNKAVILIIGSLLNDKELPVKVEAAIALQSLMSNQENSHKIIEPQVKHIALQLLILIRETENEDMTEVMQKLVSVFTVQLTPISVEICQHLVGTFSKVLNTEKVSEKKTVAAKALLNTIEDLLNVMEEKPEMHQHLEPVVLQVVVHVLQNNLQEYFEEVLSHVSELNSSRITADMWKVFELIYQVFLKDGVDYFTDMMPALHNYVTVDTDSFLSKEERLFAVLNMCKEVFGRDPGEAIESYAAKLLEVLILQCRGRIDNAIPMIIDLAANRFLREKETNELKIMCMQVLVAALYYNPHLFFSIVAEKQDFVSHYISQWLQDVDSVAGIHDRKLSVLGLCTLVNMPNRPDVVREVAPKIIPAFITLFDGLKKAYASRKHDDSDDEDEDDGESDSECESEELSSDEDDVDDENQQYLEDLSRQILMKDEKGELDENDQYDDSDSESDYDLDEETVLETYTTPLDEKDREMEEYLVFAELLHSLGTYQKEWYQTLIKNLTYQQIKAVTEVNQLANQRKAAIESRRIKQQGGYVFMQQEEQENFGTVLSLRSKRRQDTYFSLEVAGSDMKLVLASPKGTNVIRIPMTLSDGFWHLLAIGLRNESTLEVYTDCEWSSTIVLQRECVSIPGDSDLIIGYLFTGDIEQVSIAANASIVSLQCSKLKTPVTDDNEPRDERMFRPSRTPGSVLESNHAGAYIDAQQQPTRSEKPTTCSRYACAEANYNGRIRS